MRTTIDSAGRLVVPKEIRERAQLRPGMPLEIRLREGRIEIEPAPRKVRIVRRGRVSVLSAVEESEPLSAAQVRETLESVRDRD